MVVPKERVLAFSGFFGGRHRARAWCGVVRANRDVTRASFVTVSVAGILREPKRSRRVGSKADDERVESPARPAAAHGAHRAARAGCDCGLRGAGRRAAVAGVRGGASADRRGGRRADPAAAGRARRPAEGDDDARPRAHARARPRARARAASEDVERAEHSWALVCRRAPQGTGRARRVRPAHASRDEREGGEHEDVVRAGPDLRRSSEPHVRRIVPRAGRAARGAHRGHRRGSRARHDHGAQPRRGGARFAPGRVARRPCHRHQLRGHRDRTDASLA